MIEQTSVAVVTDSALILTLSKPVNIIDIYDGEDLARVGAEVQAVEHDGLMLSVTIDLVNFSRLIMQRSSLGCVGAGDQTSGVRHSASITITGNG